MYTEDDLLPISALQHLAFCERQCALIHIEQAWEENVFTAEGRVLHERTHNRETESRGHVRICRGVRLRSLRLGLSGIADVIEFHRALGNEAASENGALQIVGWRGWWRPFPVEYKRGKPKAHNADRTQLCAQAMCLEEMLETFINQGALFYGQPKRREDVSLNGALRNEVRDLSLRLHQMIRKGEVPPAVYESRKCKACSLFSICRPKSIHPRHSARNYLNKAIRIESNDHPGGGLPP